jgi:hypothetical protein
MMPSIGSGCGCSRSPMSSAVCGRLAGRWGSTPRRPAAGGRRCCARVRGAAAAGAPRTADAERDQPDGRTADPGVRARSSGVGSQPDRRRAGPSQVGRHQGLGQRGVAGAAPPRAQHSGQAPWPGGGVRGAGAGADRARPSTRAAPGRRPSWSARPDGLLLCRPSQRHPRGGVAIHRHRRRLCLHVGRAVGDPQEPLTPLDFGTGQARRSRPR